MRLVLSLAIIVALQGFFITAKRFLNPPFEMGIGKATTLLRGFENPIL